MLLKWPELSCYREGYAAHRYKHLTFVRLQRHSDLCSPAPTQVQNSGVGEQSNVYHKIFLLRKTGKKWEGIEMIRLISDSHRCQHHSYLYFLLGLNKLYLKELITIARYPTSPRMLEVNFVTTHWYRLKSQIVIEGWKVLFSRNA